MSFSALKWAFRQSLSSTEKLVLLHLAEHANEKTLQCWPSVSTLSRECSLSSRSVIRSLKKLVELGLIKKDVQHKNNRQTSNMYRLNLNPVAKIMFDGDDTESPPPLTFCHPSPDTESYRTIPSFNQSYRTITYQEIE